MKAIALAHVAELETKIAQMREMAATLHVLADACEGDHRPECPIIEDLENTVVSATAWLAPHDRADAPAEVHHIKSSALKLGQVRGGRNR